MPEIGFPLAWSFSEGHGRVFYTALGHFPAAYENVVYLAHLFGGLRWLLERRRGLRSLIKRPRRTIRT